MPAKLKVGVIGVGAIGTIHTKAYQATGEAEVAAVCDIDAPKLAAKADEFGIGRRFADYRDLLKTDVEAVSVCVPNDLHREMAVAALKAGKKVLVEKPMAINGAEAAKIVAAQKATGGLVQVGMCNRQKPEAQILREFVEQGLLGEVYHMRAVLIRHRGIPGMGGWFTTKAQSGGGPVIDLGVHWFDLCMWLADLWTPTSVSAKTYAKFGTPMRDYKYVGMWAGPPRYDGVFDVEDYTTGFVRFGKKATLSFEISWAVNSPADSFVEVLGDKGGMRILDGKSPKLLTEQGGKLVEVAPMFDAKANHFEIQARKFIQACRGKAAPAATARQGLIVNRLIDAIFKSSQTDKEVAIRI